MTSTIMVKKKERKKERRKKKTNQLIFQITFFITFPPAWMFKLELKKAHLQIAVEKAASE